MRLTLQRGEQSEFVELHGGLPQYFTAQTVMDLNKLRPLHDQLELTAGGTLKHHCGHPLCPHYLQSFATQRDLAENERRGLFRHLKLLFYPSKQYVAQFHLTADRIFARAPKPRQLVLLF